jgi:hypothetical protein
MWTKQQSGTIAYRTVGEKGDGSNDLHMVL